jgi:hypothetical protein
MTFANVAVRSAPRSEPAKSHDFLPRAMTLKPQRELFPRRMVHVFGKSHLVFQSALRGTPFTAGSSALALNTEVRSPSPNQARASPFS